MKRLFLFIAAIFISYILPAQDMVLMDPVSARPFNSEKYSEVKGSPFLFDKWMGGIVTTSAGKYKVTGVKLDAYENTLFLNKKDEAFEFNDEVVSFVLMPDVADSSSYLYFKKGFTGSGLERRQFAQVLTEGNVSLIKSVIKMVSENNEINHGVVKSFKTITRYYVIKDNVVTLLKNNNKDVIALLSNQEEKIKAFIAQNKLAAKNDRDLVRIFTYYNSL